MLLSDKVAIVTGAAGGIGRGIALRFAKEGCNVVAADINLPGAEETISEVKKLGRDGLAVQADITSSAQLQVMVDKVIEKFGRIDILVNNAGTLFTVSDLDKKSVAVIPEEQWDKLVEINLKGCFLCIKLVAPHMIKQRYGKIVNFSTIGAIHPPAVAPHYNAAKAGVLGLTYDVASELGPHNITVNAIMPGPIRTAFYDKVVDGMSEAEKEEKFAKMASGVPLQRMGTPDDIAGAVLFLASNLSSYVTGIAMPVSGGVPLSPRL